MTPDPTFRPSLAPLEDRTVPAVTLAEAQLAAAVVSSTTALLQSATSLLADPAVATNSVTRSNATSVLIPLAEQNITASNTLGQYLSELQAQAAAQPANAAGLNQLAGGVGSAQFYGIANTIYAVALATVFGGYSPPPPPVVPPPPPPPSGQPSDGTGINDDGTTGGNPTPPPTTNPTDNSGLSATIPNVATLLQQPETNGVRTQTVSTGIGGQAVEAGDTVQVYYTGWLTNGTEFDSNRTATTPTTFPLNNLIQGFQRGVIGMTVGEVRNIYIPSDLGYGAAGSGSSIPPNSDLVFQVKVVGIQ